MLDCRAHVRGETGLNCWGTCLSESHQVEADEENIMAFHRGSLIFYVTGEMTCWIQIVHQCSDAAVQRADC